MMKKTILIAMLFLFTIGLTACGNNNNDTDNYDYDTDNYDYDNDYEDVVDEESYEQEETNTADEQQSNDSDGRPENPEVSLEEAIQLAYDDLENRGISATFREDSGMEWERGQWVWELFFTTEGESMPFVEYYISVDDGSVVKFEWDD